MYGLQTEQQYSSTGLTRERYAAVFVCSLLTLRFLHKKPNMLFPFLMVWSMCLFHDILDCISTPRYPVEYSVIDFENSGILDLEILSVLHLSGWKAMSHFFSHSVSLFRSSCRISASLSFLILLYSMQSSANNRGLDWTQSGRSFMKRRNYNGPKTVP